MTTMLTLQLPAHQATFQQVQALPGLHDIPLDERYGLICLAPREGKYLVRTNTAVKDIEDRRRQSPEILAAIGDIRVEPIFPSSTDERPQTPADPNAGNPFAGHGGLWPG